MDELIKMSKSIEKDNFNNKIINSLYESSNKSFLYSGLSVREALLILFMGSTKNSVLFKNFSKLFNSDDTETLMTYYYNLNGVMSDSGSVKIANSIWNNNVKIKPEWINHIKSIGEVKNTIDQKLINEWMSEKTENTITTIPIEYDGDVSMIILNALYFCDKWKHQFKKENTVKSTFENHFGNKTTVQMMKITEKYLYTLYSENDDQFIAMDYVSDFFMLVDLPKNITKPTLMTQKVIQKIYNSMKMTEIILYFPKFTYEDSHDLLQPIIDSGFDITGKDFGSMIEKHNDSLYIKSIIQVAKIISDEEGTKAAAVTVIKNIMYAKASNYTIFKADHSFAFYIIHKPTFEILFTGVFNG